LNLRQYQSERGCTATPAGDIDGSPKPKFGALVSTSRVTAGDGPCGKMEYPVQSIGYKAGTAAGIDEFELFIFPTAFWGGSPLRIKVRVVVGGGRAAVTDAVRTPIKQEPAKQQATVQAAASTQQTSKAKGSELKPLKRQISVLRNQSVIAAYAYDLNNDCTPAGAIMARIIQEPKGGRLRIVQEPGFSNYAKDSIKFECNRQKSEVTRVYYDAADRVIEDAFSLELIYANGNSRKVEILVSVK
jgi:hypothetical protein